MKYFEKRRKKRILEDIFTRLPSELFSRYGASPTYSEKQVTATLEHGKYSEKYRGYAYAFCLSAQDASQCIGSVEVLLKLRKEIASNIFNGKEDFTLLDLDRSKNTKVGNNTFWTGDSTAVSGMD